MRPDRKRNDDIVVDDKENAPFIGHPASSVICAIDPKSLGSISSSGCSLASAKSFAVGLRTGTEAAKSTGSNGTSALFFLAFTFIGRTVTPVLDPRNREDTKASTLQPAMLRLLPAPSLSSDF